jgi:methionyl-tRNA synthetase
MIAALKSAPVKAGEYYEHYRFREGLMEIMNLARTANKYFNDSEPWKTVRSNPERCATTLHIAIQSVRSMAILLEPIVPETSLKMWGFLNIKNPIVENGWDSASDFMLKEGHQLNKPGILVNKIENKQIDEIMKFLENGDEQTPSGTKPGKSVITIDDFEKVDLRVARIVEAEKLSKSDKLLKLQIDFGSERRQIIAGIANHYNPEDLIGKLVVVVANLQPAKLMGQESQGMVLAAADDAGKLTLVTVQTDISPGSVVK